MHASFPLSIQSTVSAPAQLLGVRSAAGRRTPGIPHPLTHGMQRGLEGRAGNSRPPPSIFSSRGSENIFVAVDPAACPLPAETGETFLPRPLGFQGTLHLEGRRSLGPGDSFISKKSASSAAGGPRRPPRPLPPRPPPLGSLPPVRSGLDQCGGALGAGPPCPGIAQPGASGAERINSGPLNCISPARARPRPLCRARPAPFAHSPFMLCLANTKRPARRRALFKLRRQHLKTPRGSGTWEHLQGPGRVDSEGAGPPPRARPPRLPGPGWGRAARASPARHPRCPGHRDFLQAPAFPLKIRGTSGAPSPRLCVLNGPEVHLTQNLEA